MQFHNALADASETTFVQVTHAVEDLEILSFELEHREGDFATLNIEIKNPGSGILSGQRWMWFSVTPEGEVNATPLFFGRIIGFPSGILDEVVTLSLIGKPADFLLQKEAYADSLRVLPWYDEIFIDESRRDDPDVVLEGYSKLWHIDPVTHAVTVSDIIAGEDGTEVFTADEIFYDEFKVALGSDAPLRSVKMAAEFNWTQLANGSLDLSQYIQSNWPNESIRAGITSFSMREGSWPKAGASIGDNWTVGEGILRPLYDLTVRNTASGGTTIVIWPDGDNVQLTVNESHDRLAEVPPGSVTLGTIWLTDQSRVTYGDDGEGNRTITSWTISQTWSNGLVPLAEFLPTLTVNYKAERPHVEKVRFTLRADIQELVTLSSEDDSLIIDDMKTVNLSEPIPNDSAPYIPIGDPRRRSYLMTDRGQQSLTHLLLVARAHLLKRARAVEIAFDVLPSRVFDLSLRKNAQVNSPALPGGVAEGKIIAWRFSLSGDEGVPNVTATIACAIGNAGTLTPAAGVGTYSEADYVEADYQEDEGELVVPYSDIGFELPLFNANDDGIDFIAGVTVDSAIEQALAVENPPATQRAAITAALAAWPGSPGFLVDPNPTADRQEIVSGRATAVNNALNEVPTIATFKLRSMRKKFEHDYPVTVRTLKIPKQIDLEVP